MRKFQPELKVYLRDVLISIRQSLDLTREQMAAKLYMSPRSYCDFRARCHGFLCCLPCFPTQHRFAGYSSTYLAAFPDFIQKLEQKEAG